MTTSHKPWPDLIETKSYRIIRERLEEAADEGINAVIYGPPSSEKSFVLESLCGSFTRSGKPVIYVYCGPRCTEAHLYRSIAEAASIPIPSTLRWGCRYAILTHLRSRARLPAIILDEAQHLDVYALEGARQIHDLTRRPDREGCGIILAGSHNLLRYMLDAARKSQLEQFLSRWPKRIQLEGMTKQETLTLAARALGNGRPAKLSEKEQTTLLERCTVEDPYAIGADGRPALRPYYSSRRLLAYIRQQKKATVRKILAPAPDGAGRAPRPDGAGLARGAVA